MPDFNLPDEWNRMAEAYQKIYKLGTDDVHYGPGCPKESDLNLLGDVSGKKVIEVGCGAAQNSIFLAKKGAKVTALDFSEKQIEIGRELSRAENVPLDFVLGDFVRLEDYISCKDYDLALSAYALQYSPSLDSLLKVFSGINKILKKGGILVFSFDHPLRLCGSWDLDRNYFVINNYFDRSKASWEYDFKEEGIITRGSRIFSKQKPALITPFITSEIVPENP